MKPSPETQPQVVRTLVRLARRELLRSAGAGPRELELESLVRAQRGELVQRRQRTWALGFVAAAALVALVAVAVQRTFSRPEPLLAYTVSQAAIPAQPRRISSTRYSFADGTAISLGHDAALTVVSAERRSPRVRLEHGGAEIRVVHRPDAQWRFMAGPFEVKVVGTAFDLTWDPLARKFSLNLREGAVEVTGPVLDGPVQVRAGHRLSVSLAIGEVAITAGSATSEVAALFPATSAPEPGPPSAPTTSSSADAIAPSPASVVPPQVSWRSLLSRGRFDEVLRAAQAFPLPACLARCSESDLRALGDAARYSGRPALAEPAFLALRRRFPGTAESAVAAFLLGRTFEAQHRPASARVWFERYLSEAPSGEFANEATAGRARSLEVH